MKMGDCAENVVLGAGEADGGSKDRVGRLSPSRGSEPVEHFEKVFEAIGLARVLARISHHATVEKGV